MNSVYYLAYFTCQYSGLIFLYYCCIHGSGSICQPASESSYNGLSISGGALNLCCKWNARRCTLASFWMSPEYVNEDSLHWLFVSNTLRLTSTNLQVLLKLTFYFSAQMEETSIAEKQAQAPSQVRPRQPESQTSTTNTQTKYNYKRSNRASELPLRSVSHNMS